MLTQNGFDSLTFNMGIVENNYDPTNSGRVQVRCFGVHPDVSSGLVQTSDLPWALVLNGTGGKFHSIPDNGDWVFVAFMDGRDAQHPLVMGIVNGVRNSLPHLGAGNARQGDDTANPQIVDGTLVGTDNAEKAYNYYISQGFTPEQSAGIVGNLQAESGYNLNANSFNSAGGGNGAKGIAQWRGDRQAAFAARYGHDILNGTFEEQLDFTMYEFRTTEKAAYDAIKNSTTSADSARAFDEKYERSGGGTITKRVGNANALLNLFSGKINTTQDDSANPYLNSSSDAVRNYGNPPLPPQMTGEDIELTPVAVVSALSNPNDPGVPFNGNINSSVWQTRYGGTFIELSGKENTDEFLNIMHSSGSHISIDQHGSVIIRAFGDEARMIEGNSYEGIAGSKNIKATEGYSLEVSGGKCIIHSAGDLSITSGGDLSIGSGKKLTINGALAVDISGSRIALSSREDSIDLLSNNKVNITASVDISLKGSGDIKLGGSKIYLNDPGGVPENSIGADVGPLIKPQIEPSPPVISTPLPLSPNMVDDPGGILA